MNRVFVDDAEPAVEYLRNRTRWPITHHSDFAVDVRCTTEELARIVRDDLDGWVPNQFWTHTLIERRLSDTEWLLRVECHPVRSDRAVTALGGRNCRDFRGEEVVCGSRTSTRSPRPLATP